VSGSTGGRVWWRSGGSDLCGRPELLIVWRWHREFDRTKVLTRTSCTVKSHRTQKTIRKANTLHMRGQKDQARLKPNLFTSKELPADVTIKSIAVQGKEIGVQVAYFAGLGVKQEKDGFLGSSPNKFSRDFRTSKKLKLINLLAVDAETLPMMMIVKPAELKKFPLPLNPNARPDEYAGAQKVGLTAVLTEWHRVSVNFEVLFEEFK
jgi:hypothetical protein